MHFEGYPEVKGYDSSYKESFSEYMARWPRELSCIPECIVENWIYRHWGYIHHWLKLKPHNWTYKLVEFANESVLSIDHCDDWMETLDGWGGELTNPKNFRRDTWLGKYMLESGTTPSPIVIATNRSHIKYPPYGIENLKLPYQLIEGHMRLAYLRGMIKSNVENLHSTHQVWVVEIPKQDALLKDPNLDT